MCSSAANVELHSKSDLIAKVQSDNPSWKEDRVEDEVTRFMMDMEGTNMYIKFLKDKKMNPRDYAAEAEAELSLSNPRTVCIALHFIMLPEMLGQAWQLIDDSAHQCIV